MNCPICGARHGHRFKGCDHTLEEMLASERHLGAKLGPAENILHPDLGWVKKDGKITELGIDYLQYKKNTEVIDD